MTHPFDDIGLELTEELRSRLAHDGIETPTGAQRAAIPAILAGRDAVIQSGTGTGKTLAYVLPLLERARRDPSFRALILAPSPELAMQILRSIEAYKPRELGTASLVGAGNIQRQKERLKKHPRFLVGTPGRVLELIFARKVRPQTLAALVLDEVDEILSPANDLELRKICARPEVSLQLIVASATIAKRAEAFVRDFMDKARLRVQLDDSPMRSRIDHRYVELLGRRDEAALIELLEQEQIERALVFVRHGFFVPKLFCALRDHGIASVTLSADGDKLRRKRALDAFARREANLLIATDAAARGLDIAELDLVIHFELPNDDESYLHRAGRTARAGRRGTSLLMVTRDEHAALLRLAHKLRLEIKPRS